MFEFWSSLPADRKDHPWRFLCLPLIAIWRNCLFEGRRTPYIILTPRHNFACLQFAGCGLVFIFGPCIRSCWTYRPDVLIFEQIYFEQILFLTNSLPSYWGQMFLFFNKFYFEQIFLPSYLGKKFWFLLGFMDQNVCVICISIFGIPSNLLPICIY